MPPVLPEAQLVSMLRRRKTQYRDNRIAVNECIRVSAGSPKTRSSRRFHFEVGPGYLPCIPRGHLVEPFARAEAGIAVQNAMLGWGTIETSWAIALRAFA